MSISISSDEGECEGEGDCTHVLVTGANGFLATALISHLLNQGYFVHATCRPTSVHNIHPSLLIHSHLRIFETSLSPSTSTTTFEDAARGCHAAVHLAAPMAAELRRCDVTQCVCVARSFLNVCETAGVRNVVVVSSHQAVTQGGQKMKLDRNGNRKNVVQKVFDESDWNSESSIDVLPSYYAKTQMEKAVWQYVDEQRKRNGNGNASKKNKEEDKSAKQTETETERMEEKEGEEEGEEDSETSEESERELMKVVVVNPAFMWGRAIAKSHNNEHNTDPDLPSTSTSTSTPACAWRGELNVSKEVLVQLGRGEVPGICDVAMPVVHVRDVASIILRLLLSRTASGRYIVCPPCGESVSVRDMVTALRAAGVNAAPTRDLSAPGFTRFLRVVSHATPGGVAGQYLRAVIANCVRLSSSKLVNELNKKKMKESRASSASNSSVDEESEGEGEDEGFKFISAKETLEESIEEIIEDGRLESVDGLKVSFNFERFKKHQVEA